MNITYFQLFPLIVFYTKKFNGVDWQRGVSYTCREGDISLCSLLEKWHPFLAKIFYNGLIVHSNTFMWFVVGRMSNKEPLIGFIHTDRQWETLEGQETGRYLSLSGGLQGFEVVYRSWLSVDTIIFWNWDKVSNIWHDTIHAIYYTFIGK